MRKAGLLAVRFGFLRESFAVKPSSPRFKRLLDIPAIPAVNFVYSYMITQRIII